MPFISTHKVTSTGLAWIFKLQSLFSVAPQHQSTAVRFDQKRCGKFCGYEIRKLLPAKCSEYSLCHFLVSLFGEASRFLYTFRFFVIRHFALRRRQRGECNYANNSSAFGNQCVAQRGGADIAPGATIGLRWWRIWVSKGHGFNFNRETLLCPAACLPSSRMCLADHLPLNTAWPKPTSRP